MRWTIGVHKSHTSGMERGRRPIGKGTAIPGCNTAGDTLKEALANVQEAVELMLEDATEKPAPSSLEHYKDDPAYQDVAWTLVDVDMWFMDGPADGAHESDAQ